jgi:hypothetical protein
MMPPPIFVFGATYSRASCSVSSRYWIPWRGRPKSCARPSTCRGHDPTGTSLYGYVRLTRDGMVNGFTCATMGLCPLSAMAFPLFFLRHPRRPLKVGCGRVGCLKGRGEKDGWGHCGGGDSSRSRGHASGCDWKLHTSGGSSHCQMVFKMTVRRMAVG